MNALNAKRRPRQPNCGSARKRPIRAAGSDTPGRPRRFGGSTRWALGVALAILTLAPRVAAETSQGGGLPTPTDLVIFAGGDLGQGHWAEFAAELQNAMKGATEGYNLPLIAKVWSPKPNDVKGIEKGMGTSAALDRRLFAGAAADGVVVSTASLRKVVLFRVHRRQFKYFLSYLARDFGKSRQSLEDTERFPLWTGLPPRFQHLYRTCILPHSDADTMDVYVRLNGAAPGNCTVRVGKLKHDLVPHRFAGTHWAGAKVSVVKLPRPEGNYYHLVVGRWNRVLHTERVLATLATGPQKIEIQADTEFPTELELEPEHPGAKIEIHALNDQGQTLSQLPGKLQENGTYLLAPPGERPAAGYEVVATKNDGYYHGTVRISPEAGALVKAQIPMPPPPVVLVVTGNTADKLLLAAGRVPPVELLLVEQQKSKRVLKVPPVLLAEIDRVEPNDLRAVLIAINPTMKDERISIDLRRRREPYAVAIECVAYGPARLLLRYEPDVKFQILAKKGTGLFGSYTKDLLLRVPEHSQAALTVYELGRGQPRNSGKPATFTIKIKAMRRDFFPREIPPFAISAGQTIEKSVSPQTPTHALVHVKLPANGTIRAISSNTTKQGVQSFPDHKIATLKVTGFRGPDSRNKCTFTVSAWPFRDARESHYVRPGDASSVSPTFGKAIPYPVVFTASPNSEKTKWRVDVTDVATGRSVYQEATSRRAAEVRLDPLRQYEFTVGIVVSKRRKRPEGGVPKELAGELGPGHFRAAHEAGGVAVEVKLVLANIK